MRKIRKRDLAWAVTGGVTMSVSGCGEKGIVLFPFMSLIVCSIEGISILK